MAATESMLIRMSQDFLTNWNTVFLVLYRSLAPMAVPPFVVFTLIAIATTSVIAEAVTVIMVIAIPKVIDRIFDLLPEEAVAVDVDVMRTAVE